MKISQITLLSVIPLLPFSILANDYQVNVENFTATAAGVPPLSLTFKLQPNLPSNTCIDPQKSTNTPMLSDLPAVTAGKKGTGYIGNITDHSGCSNGTGDHKVGVDVYGNGSKIASVTFNSTFNSSTSTWTYSDCGSTFVMVTSNYAANYTGTCWASGQSFNLAINSKGGYRTSVPGN